MSQQQPSPTSSLSSPPSLPIAKKVEPIAQPDPFVIRYGETDDDCVAIYNFLLAVAGPVLIGRVDPAATIAEIMRIRDQGAPIMCFCDGYLVGLLGLTRAQWWYGPDTFMTDRWFFVLPDLKFKGAATRMLAEAAAVAASSGQTVIINGHMRPRGNNIYFTRPHVFTPPKDTDDVLRRHKN